MREFDVVVLGAGAAGEVAAGRLGENGLSVAIVEDRLVGGECSFYACMPSKALLRPVELAREAARVPGLDVGPIDAAAVLRRRDDVIAHLDDTGQVPWLETAASRSFEAVGGSTANGASSSTARSSGRRRAVIVATGSAALVPEIEGLRDARPWTNIEATTATEVPRRLAVLGGGVVGVELAQAWAALGSAVTLVHRGERLIEREEPFAGAQVLDALREGGVDVRLAVLGAARLSSRCGRDRARRRNDARSRRGAGCVRPRARNRRDRPGDDRDRAGRPARRRRRPSRSRARLAVRGRRRQRPRAPHAHGQVPGADRRGHDSGPRRAPALGWRAFAAGHLHRPAGRLPSASRSRQRRSRVFGSVTSMSRRAATPVARSWVAALRERRGSSSMRTGE